MCVLRQVVLGVDGVKQSGIYFTFLLFIPMLFIPLVPYLPQQIDKNTAISWIATVKKIINQSGSFENTEKWQRQPMKLFKNRRCPSIAVCYNPTKCVLNTMQFVHVENGQTPEQRVAVVEMTAHQGICC